MRPASSLTGCSAKNSLVTRRSVASSATAFAPFSQNSAVCRLPGSGQAQPGQSKPSFWLTRIRVSAVRLIPIWVTLVVSPCTTPGIPAALVFGGLTRSSASSGGGLLAMLRAYASAAPCVVKRRADQVGAALHNKPGGPGYTPEAICQSLPAFFSVKPVPPVTSGAWW